jgi:hypothetical protein
MALKLLELRSGRPLPRGKIPVRAHLDNILEHYATKRKVACSIPDEVNF